MLWGYWGRLNWCWGGGWKVVMEAFLWCWGVLKDVLGALGCLGDVLEVF